MTQVERLLVEAIGNLFNNSEQVLGVVPHDEKSHTFEFQWNNIESMFALKARRSNFHEELTSAFRDIHSYKYLDDPTFAVALQKHLTARGVPTEEINRAVQFCEQIKEELNDEQFQEKDSGWHPDLDEVLDTTRNAQTREPKQQAPYTGGGPAPSLNEIS